MGVTAIFILLSLGPTVGSCSTQAPVTFGDATSGLIWQTWIWDQPGRQPWSGANPFVNSPIGEPLWNPLNIVSIVPLSVLWLASQAVGPICAYSYAYVAFSILNIASLLVLFQRLRLHFSVAMSLTLYLVFGQFLLFKVTNQLGFFFVAPVVLAIIAMLRWNEDFQFRWMVVAGMAVGILAYVDGYLLPVGVAVLVSWIAAFAVLPVQAGLRRRVIAGVALGCLVAAVVATPAFLTVLFYSPASDVVETARELSEFDAYALRLGDALLPSADHPYFGTATVALTGDGEVTGLPISGVFLGGLAVLGSVALIVSLKTRTIRLCAAREIVVFASLTLLGLLLVLPPEVEIFNLKFHTTTRLLYEWFPFLRVLSRFSLLIYLGTLGFIAVILASSWSRIGPRARGAVASMFAIVVLLDIGFPRGIQLPIFSFADAPPVYTWLASLEQREARVLSDLTRQEDVDGSFATPQIVHGWTVVNPKTASMEVQDALTALVHPQVACIANAVGASLLLRHTSGEPIPKIDYSNLRASFRSHSIDAEDGGWPAFWFDVDVYEPSPSLYTSGFLSFGTGFGPGIYEASRGYASTDSFLAKLETHEVPGRPSEEVDFAIDMRGPILKQLVRFVSDSGLQWEGVIGQDWNRVNFTARPGEVIEISARDITTGLPVNLEISIGRFAAGDCK